MAGRLQYVFSTPNHCSIWEDVKMFSYLKAACTSSEFYIKSFSKKKKVANCTDAVSKSNMNLTMYWHGVL